MGRFWMAVSETTLLTSVRAVSIRGASAVTVTSSATLAGRSCTSTVVVAPTEALIPERGVMVKPESVAFTS
jgi:hypothetical protein